MNGIKKHYDVESVHYLLSQAVSFEGVLVSSPASMVWVQILASAKRPARSISWLIIRMPGQLAAPATHVIGEGTVQTWNT